MASKAATLGDPRRPQEVRRLRIPPPADDVTSLFILLATWGVGMFATMTQSKALLWVAVFGVLSAASHMNMRAAQTSQTLMVAFMLLAGGFMQAYWRPAAMMQRKMMQEQPAAQQTAAQAGSQLEDD